MQVTVENISELGRRMTVTVEDANVEQSVQQKLKSIRPTMKAPGFRPGKVPMKMVEQQHGPAARRSVIDELVQNSMTEAFVQEGINPASAPQLEEINEKDSSFVYSLSYEVFPEITAVNLDDVTIEQTVAEVTDEDVDAMIETLREQRASWEPLKRGVKEEERITVDFTGTIDGEEFQGGKGVDVHIVMGAGQMLPEFEEQLMGKKTGQNTTVTITFPEDYQAKELAGKTADFAVLVKDVAKKKLPKVDKGFAALCGVEDGVAALKKEVKANMVRELANALKNKNKRVVLDSLTKNNEVNLPEAPVEREAQHLMERAKANLQQQGVNIEGIPFTSDGFKDQARQRVALSLLIGKIITDNNIEADDNRVKAVVDNIASSYEDPEDVVNYYMNDPQRLSELKMMVVEDQVVEWICEQVKVEEVSSSFSEVMNSASA